jgi:hypothetical protein
MGNNEGGEGIYASGKEVCCNAGRSGRFIPCFCENIAKSLPRESGCVLWL